MPRDAVSRTANVERTVIKKMEYEIVQLENWYNHYEACIYEMINLLSDNNLFKVKFKLISRKAHKSLQSQIIWNKIAKIQQGRMKWEYFFRIFNEYIFRLPQGTVTQLNLACKISQDVVSCTYTETNNTVQ